MAAVLRTVAGAVGSAIVTICVAALLAGLAGFAFVPLDSVNILAPYLLFMGLTVLCGLCLVLRRKPLMARWRLLAIALAFFVAAAAALLAPLQSRQPVGEATARLRIVSYNMYKANAEPEAVMRWLAAERADVIILLEAPDLGDPALAGLRREYPYAYSCSRSGKCSTRIFSRFPAMRSRPLAQGDANNRQSLSAVTVTFRVHGRKVPVTAAHLSRPWPLGTQRTELAALERAMAGAGRGGILAGDFNSAPWTFALRRLAEAGDLRLGSGTLATWPARGLPYPVLPLDQLYLGRCLSLLSLATGPRLGSDHLPLVAEIGLAQCAD